MYMSPTRTANDWKAVRAQFNTLSPASDWARIVRDFFHARIDSRYLQPIARIQKYGTKEGEGFSIVTLQCALIEFLESTIQGVNYRYTRRPQDLGPYEYMYSGSIFRSFLTTRKPFASVFSQEIAEDFYASVRCGLLHEAQTKGGWQIRARGSSGQILDVDEKILFRDNFQSGLVSVTEGYEHELLSDVTRREAFLRKFDNLAES